MGHDSKLRPGVTFILARRADVRFGSKADICSAQAYVRSTPNSDRKSGHRQTVMSALPPIADVCSARGYVCFGPMADMVMCRPSCSHLEFKLTVDLDPDAIRQLGDAKDRTSVLPRFWAK